MPLTRLILVGGFLGAGKTTLLVQAAERLARRGKRVGLITNDQAANLVDTAILQEAGSVVEEISDGCFCCRFQDLIAATQRLLSRFNPDVLISEPVGSCTDLSATVLQPIKKLYSDRFRLSPLSVLVDPARAMESLRGQAQSGFCGQVLYIFRKQLEEADAIVLNKADVVSSAESAEIQGMLAEQFPHVPIFPMSALRGDGVDSWLDFVQQEHAAGRQIADVDYDEYAAGEAALGWLNATVQLRADGKTDWAAFCRELLQAVQDELRALSAEIAHIKLRLAAGRESLVANLTGNNARPLVQGTIPGAPGEAMLLVNARAQVGPDQLRGVLERSLRAVAGERVKTTIIQMRSFSPARPQPAYRFDCVVQEDHPLT